MRREYPLLVFASIFCLLSACGDISPGEAAPDLVKRAQNLPSEALSPSPLGLDHHLVIAAVSAEINATELNKFATRRAYDRGLQQYCLALVREHNAMQQELTRLAGRRGAATPTALSVDGQHHIDTLFVHHGPSFDREYLVMTLSLIRDTRVDLERMTREAQDVEVRAWASRAAAAWQRDDVWARHVHASIFTQQQGDTHSDDPFSSLQVF